MIAMKQTSKKSRLQADSYKEIVDAFSDLVTAMAKDTEFRGIKLRPAHVINALVYDVLTRPEAERKAYVRDTLGRLEAFLADENATIDAGGDPVVAPMSGGRQGPPDVKEVTNEHTAPIPAPSPRRKRKSR